MKLITGGAYSGKRNYVRSLAPASQLGWISCYEEHELEQWGSRWTTCTKLVLEGWECWIEKKLAEGMSAQKIEQRMMKMVADLVQVERDDEARLTGKEAYLIVLEMGRGIVPVRAEDRMLRDMIGRLSQEAARHADEVIYLWHGLPQVLHRSTMK